jgi:hypothetical protein
MTDFEHRDLPPLSRRHFIRRFLRHVGYGAIVVGLSVLGGTVGYRFFAGFSWVDSFLNASMLLGGLGPVGDLPSAGAKIFASLFALYSGLVFLILAGVLLAPIFHRVLHKFHWETAEEGDRD